MADTDSRLMALPAELRNRIYELVFHNHIVDCNTPRNTTPGLLITSKKVHAESHGIYYSSTTFISKGYVTVFADRLSKISIKNRDLIETIVLDHGSDDAIVAYSVVAAAGAIPNTSPSTSSYLNRAALLKQLNVFRFHECLTARGASDLISKVQASAVVNAPGRVVRSREPWLACCAEFKKESLEDLHPWMYEFFEYQHSPTRISQCWLDWWHRGYQKYGKCRCPKKPGRIEA